MLLVHDDFFSPFVFFIREFYRQFAILNTIKSKINSHPIVLILFFIFYYIQINFNSHKISLFQYVIFRSYISTMFDHRAVRRLSSSNDSTDWI